MAAIKSSRSTFPRAPFFIIRFLQLVCCTVVLGVLGYFQYHLWNDGFKNPYEFSLLDFVASVTLLNILITAILLLCRGLSALAIIIVDAFLTVLWTVFLILLMRAMGKTTTQTCDVDGWGSSEGVRVCQMFKVLVAFTVLAAFWSFAMVVLAVVTRKREARHEYKPAHNPANLHQTNTSYAPSSYGAPAPAVYNAADVKRYSDVQQPEIKIYGDVQQPEMAQHHQQWHSNIN